MPGPWRSIPANGAHWSDASRLVKSDIVDTLPKAPLNRRNKKQGHEIKINFKLGLFDANVYTYTIGNYRIPLY